MAEERSGGAGRGEPGEARPRGATQDRTGVRNRDLTPGGLFVTIGGRLTDAEVRAALDLMASENLPPEDAVAATIEASMLAGRNDVAQNDTKERRRV